MENIIAYFIMFVMMVAVVGATAFLIRKYRKSRETELKRLAERQELIRKYNNELMEAPAPKMRTPTFKPSERMLNSPKYSPDRWAPTTSSKSDDGFLNGVLTGMIVDAAVGALSHKSGDDSYSSKSESSSSSWGLDDSDSRKSISDSFSSSWSDDSSSSSDSGPSSDW